MRSAAQVPEAARLLRPGGRLVFLTNSVLTGLCVPRTEGYAGERAAPPTARAAGSNGRKGAWSSTPGRGEWIKILRENGYRIEALHELYAPAGAEDHEYYDIATAEWAQKWPVEDLWVARLIGQA